MSISDKKKELRAEIRKRLKDLSRENSRLSSRRILENLVTADEWKTADTVFAFLPMLDEADTIPVIEEAFRQGKKVAVPRIEGDEISFRIIDTLYTQKLEMHIYGMREPLSTLPEAEIGPGVAGKVLVLVPGLAFDKECRRLGRGKSFYDRFLSRHNGELTTAGLAFSIQITDKVPVESHDFQLDLVVTENAIYKKQ